MPIPQDYLLADEELDNKPLRTAEEAYYFFRKEDLGSGITSGGVDCPEDSMFSFAEQVH
ncbi:hypothetical protein [Sporomusa silvacetica]|uniref:hypothetical protein n=1 Tax=Sporomusa silvacetica TaxID=55504 RepID=UPI00146CE0AB|nr:hypothetical protein [Sporomusa silvacetica]